MRRSWLLVCTFALGSIAAACGSNTSTTAPSRAPGPAALPLAEGTYDLRLTSVGAPQGCQIAHRGTWRGPGEIALGGGFESELTLRAEGSGWVGRATRNGQSGEIVLRLDAGGPRSTRLTGTLQGLADQRAFDGPRVEVTGRSGDRPASFDGMVVGGGSAPGRIATGEARGRFVYESGWFGTVITCDSATVTVTPVAL